MHHLAKQNYFWTREQARDELEWSRASEVSKDLPRPLVLVTGVFDLMHAGHMRMLFAAREKAGTHGTVLVALNSDEWVRVHKGNQRPILNFVERAAALNYMPIDVLCELNSERELRDLTMRLRPDLKVMGSDHVDVVGKYPYMRKMLVRNGGVSTSTIITRILERYNG